jgi:periplasmic protein TonB
MPLSRNALIALAVVLLHVGLLVLLQSGLLMRATELLVPVEVLVRLIEPPVVVPTAPVVEPPRPVAKAPPPPVARPIPPRAEAAPDKPPPPAPLPPAAAEPSPPAPAPNAPTALPAPPQPAPPVAAAPAPPTVQLPSSDADYLQNPKPAYPETSRRLNEQGTSTIRVLIGADGQPQRAEIGKSSGFDRLDRAALATVMRWRFVPGKRNGVSEAMWFNVPIAWGLSNP